MGGSRLSPLTTEDTEDTEDTEAWLEREHESPGHRSVNIHRSMPSAEGEEP